MSVSMETQEHFYSDDPSRGPVDGKTTLGGVDYFHTIRMVTQFIIFKMC